MGGEYRIRTQNTPKSVRNIKNTLDVELQIFYCGFYFLVLFFIFRAFGGILGSDAVLTTCILCEKVKLTDPPREEHRNTNPIPWNIFREECEAIYYEASHLTHSHKKFIKFL